MVRRVATGQVEFFDSPDTLRQSRSQAVREQGLRYAREWASTQDDFHLDDEWVFVREEGDRTYHTVHRFHPYYALFPPPLIQKLVTSYSRPGQLVVDCFCGGGVTAVESMLLGRDSYSSDISPLAALITKAKTTPITIPARWLSEFSQEVHEAVSTIKFGRKRKGLPIPAMHNIDHWFSPGSQSKLASILQLIRQVKDPDRRDFLLVAFSSILRKCSTAQNLESHLRVRKGKKPADPMIFIARLHDMVRRMETFRERVPRGVRAEVACGDARTLSQRLDASVVDLVITSPPYGTTAKYTSIAKLSFDWLGLPRPVKPLENAKDFLGALTDCMREVFTVLKPAGRCCLVYGTNKEYGSGQVITAMRLIGFEPELAVAAPIIDASKSVRGDYRRGIPIEHVLVLQKA